MKDPLDPLNVMSLHALAEVSAQAHVVMNAMSQYMWIMERHLNPRRIEVKGDRSKAHEDFTRLCTHNGYYISSAIFLNSVEFERTGSPGEAQVDAVRVDMTKAEISRMMLGNLENTITASEHSKNKRRLERVAQAGVDYGLFKVNRYPGCGNKKPFVTTPLLTAIMNSTHGEMSIAKNFIRKNPPIVNYPVKDGTYA